MKAGLRHVTWLLIVGLTVGARPSAQPNGGAIGGTIVDTDGVPLSGLDVVVELVPGSASLLRITTRTDGTGRYRTDVGPGRYLVRTGGCPRERDPQPCSMDAPIYIYHPNTTSRAQASVISIDAGASRDDVNFVVDHATVKAMQQEGARLQSLAPELWRLRSYAPPPTASWRSLEEMHKYFVATFIATPGMGSGRMSGVLLQIDPKQQLLLPYDGSTANAGSSQNEQSVWSVKELDLIGIAMHARPVVFSRVAHGVYAEADRPLTSFEQQSLETLGSGKDIVTVRGDGRTMLLIGAIRAESACLSCHRTERTGAVLGAFRYVLQPASAARPVSLRR